MKSTTNRTWRASHLSAGTWVILAGFSLIPMIVSAADPIESTVAVEKDSSEKATDDPGGSSSPLSVLEAEKKRKALAGLAAVGAIAILGVGVIAATMMWARRLRRLARDFGPPQKTLGNDFWFLKPPKPIATESEISTTHRPPLGEKRVEQE